MQRTRAAPAWLRGFKNYLDDLRKNGGYPSQVDKSKFKVGENIANTPGAVVYRDEIAEVLQYTPTTKKGLRSSGLHRSPTDQQVLLVRHVSGKRASSGMPSTRGFRCS